MEMACRTVWRCVVFTEPDRPFLQNRALFSVPLTSGGSSSSASLRSQNYGRIGVRNFHSGRRIHLNCLQNESQSSSEMTVSKVRLEKWFLKPFQVSKAEGRVGQTANVVIGVTVADDGTNEWLALDQKVNSYPTVRSFTAIGTGGDDFVQAMVVTVESVIQKPIPEGHVKQKSSSWGKYVSVNIGPIQFSSSEQLSNVYDLESLTTLRII